MTTETTTKIMLTVLKSQDFGEWGWIECDTATNEYGETCQSFGDYENTLDAAGVEYEITDELSGRIHNEHGRVYKCADGFNHPDGEPSYTYVMVWEA